MKIEYVTHASLMFDNGKTRLLLDPFYFFDGFLGSFMCHFPPREMTPESLGKVDYIFSSHIHPDHCHQNTLKEIRTQVREVLLPDERNALVKLYTGLGFHEPHILKRGETVNLAGGVNITVYWDGTVDTAAVVEMDGCTILHQNDCRLSPQTLKTIASRHRIDFAFLLYTSSQSLFPFILDRSMEDRESLAKERELGLLNYQVSCVELLQPKVVVPYSMTMTFTQEETMYVNALWRFTPHTFCNALRERCGGIECLVMHPGDQIEWSRQGYQVIQKDRPKDYWGHSREEYVENVSQFLASNRDKLPRFDFGSTPHVIPQLVEHLQDRMGQKPPPPINERVVCLNIFDREMRDSVVIDLAACRVRRATPADMEPYLAINSPASLIELLVNGVIDPFVALYTHEISFNLYNKRALEPEQEGMIYLDTVFFLFAKAPSKEIAETDGMRLARRGSPYL